MSGAPGWLRARASIVAIVAIVSATLGLTSCAETARVLRVATSVGPYSVLFQKAIEPALRDLGYQVEYVHKPQLSDAVAAVAKGEADLNVEQNELYTNAYNQIHDSDLINLGPTPTIPMTLQSVHHRSLAEMAPGQEVVVPVFPGNSTRAMLLLEKARMVTFRADANPSRLTLEDIVSNPHDLRFVQKEPTELVAAAQTADWIILPGSIVMSLGFDDDYRVISEDFDPRYFIQMTVKSKDRNTTWASAIVRTYKSPQFEQYINSINSDSRWLLPETDAA